MAIYAFYGDTEVGFSDSGLGSMAQNLSGAAGKPALVHAWELHICRRSREYST